MLDEALLPAIAFSSALVALYAALIILVRGRQLVRVGGLETWAGRLAAASG
jgi:hypothetical protein